jgi:hypothetical protein
MRTPAAFFKPYLPGPIAAVAGGVSGTGGINTSVPTVAGAGVVGHVGTGAPSITQAIVAASGLLGHLGIGAPSITQAIVAASGLLGHLGIGAATAPVTSASGAGTVSSGVTGTGALTAPAVTVSGSGSITAAPGGGGGRGPRKRITVKVRATSPVEPTARAKRPRFWQASDSRRIQHDEEIRRGFVAADDLVDLLDLGDIEMVSGL